MRWSVLAGASGVCPTPYCDGVVLHHEAAACRAAGVLIGVVKCSFGAFRFHPVERRLGVLQDLRMRLVRPEAAEHSPSVSGHTARLPKILVFDSGLGGLTVFAEIVRMRPGAHYVYAADDAVFPYGGLSEAALVRRVLALMERLIALQEPDVAVIACNTASTLVLPPLRARWPKIPFVGTVPAIKPAAAASRSRMISVLATPGTVAREYTHDLVRAFAADCLVTLVGAPGLAVLAEAAMRGEAVSDADIKAEIAPAFVEEGARRTDVIVLACTHYPLLGPALERLAPWPVTWIDPAPAVARRVETILAGLGVGTGEGGNGPPPAAALFTSAPEPGAALRRFLHSQGLGEVGVF